MADATNDLIFDILKKIQDELAQVRTGQRSAAEELSAIRGHMVAVQKDIHNLYDLSHDTGARLERIERRLELKDEKV